MCNIVLHCYYLEDDDLEDELDKLLISEDEWNIIRKNRDLLRDYVQDHKSEKHLKDHAFIMEAAKYLVDPFILALLYDEINLIPFSETFVMIDNQKSVIKNFNYYYNHLANKCCFSSAIYDLKLSN